MAVIPPRSQDFIDYIYVDEQDGRYSQLIKQSSMPMKTNSSSGEILIQDMYPFDYAKQFNKIIEGCNNNRESKNPHEVYEFQPKTIHPDKLKIPKYFLTMKSRGGGKVQRMYNTPFELKGTEQKNLESTSDGENTTHDDSKNTNANKISLQQQRKMRQIIQEDEFITNYKKQINHTKARLLFDKKNQIRFSSIGKQRQDCMKIYDELKREQQQIWFEKITRNSLLKEAGHNKKGISQYFSSSTENLANFENSQYMQNQSSPIQNNNNNTSNTPTNNYNSPYLNTNMTQSMSVNNMQSLNLTTKSISQNNPTNSKSMTNLQKIMAQLATPKRDFFFSSNINFSSKKDSFVNKILHNVSSLKSLDEDSIMKSVTKQVQNNLQSKKPKIVHYRSKSVIVQGINQKQKSDQKSYTPIHKRGGEYEQFSQSCINLSSPDLTQQQRHQYFYSKSSQKLKAKTNNAVFDSFNPDGYSYSYGSHKNLNDSQFNTPIKPEIIKENLEESDNKIIQNMKQIIKKYQKPHQPDDLQVSVKQKTIQTNTSNENQMELHDLSPPKKYDKHRAIFDFLTKQKLPNTEMEQEIYHQSPIIKQQTKNFLSHPKNQALLNSKIIEKLNNFQKDVSDNRAFFQDTRGIRSKQIKTPSVKFGLSQNAQKKVNEFQMKAIQQFRELKC